MYKKLIILSWGSLDSRILELFAIRELVDLGVNVEYLDVADITIASYSIPPGNVPDGVKCIKIHSKKELSEKLKKDNKETTLYLPFMNYGHSSYSCYRLLSSNNCSMIYCVNGCQPYPQKPLFSKGKLKRFFSRQLFYFLRDKYYMAIIRLHQIHPVDFLLKTCSTATPVGSCKVDRHTKIIEYNSGDYQRCLIHSNDTKRLINEDYFVFLDQNIPFHPDNHLIGTHYDPNNYFSVMNQIFNLVEKKYGKRVVIAAHPSCAGEYKQTDYFNGRGVYFGKSMELVKFSSGVILHDTTALSFPIIFRKPVLFVITDAMKRVKPLSLELCSLWASLLDAPIISSEDRMNIPIEWIINEEAYSRYKYSYLTNASVEKISNGTILSNLLTM